METLVQDLRYTVRTLRKSPGFTLIAVLTLAIGIGANTAIFSIINAVLLEPLPYKNPEQLVLIWHNYPKLNLPEASVSAPSYVEYRDLTSSFEQVATGTGWSVNLTGVGEPERLRGARVSYNLFSALGVEPAQGRGFAPDEDQPGKNRVVVLSHGCWQRRFGGRSDTVGSTIALDGIGYTVVGIMPPGFSFFTESDLWTPIAFTPEQLSADNHGNEYLICVARMKPGIQFGQAQAEMNTLAAQLREQFYGPNSEWGISLVKLSEQFVGDIRPVLLIVLAAVACVLLIACANVANLLLARAASRQKEIAVRTALGAGRARIVRQLLTESALLSTVGGAVGLAFAYAGTRLVVAGMPQELSDFILGWKHIGINGKMLAFTLVVSLITGVAFGLMPSLQASKPDLNESLKEGGRSGSEGARRNSVRSVLVVFELAISLVLLISASLLVRSFIRLEQVSPGFNPAGVLTMQMSLPESKYAQKYQRSAFFDRTVKQVEALPGVSAAAVVNNLPMSGDNSNASFTIEGLQVAPGEPSPHGDPHPISPGYFEAMGIRLLVGRQFTDEDSKDSPPVAIIDQTLSDRYWPGDNPIGKRLAAFFEGSRNELLWRTIVGVVDHVKQYGLDGKTRVQYYFPQTQRPQSDMYLVVRTSSDPGQLTASIRGAVASVDPDEPIYKVMAMDQIVSNSVAPKRFAMSLLAIFAGVALLLAMVGIYGVMSYSVTQRTHEVGIRMALGAQGADVLRLVLGHGMLLTLIGVVVGLVGAFALTRFMSSLLFGVGAYDPVTFFGIPVLLAGVALVACLIPALRAARVDPMIALRYE